MSQFISDEAVLNATGKTWDEWFALLENADASQLPHAEIAQMLQDEHAVPGWWAQSITVEYERFIGRREVGQTSSGDFQAAASKTLPGAMDTILEAWQAHVGNATEFNGVAFADEASISKTGNWRYWRVGLVDGSRVNVTIGQKTADKTQLAVNHTRLSDGEAVDQWKSYWRDVLQKL